MASLVLGPILRYVSETEATVWVETSAPCEVEVLGAILGQFDRDEEAERQRPADAAPDEAPGTLEGYTLLDPVAKVQAVK